MKEQARRVARKAAVRYWDWRERPGRGWSWNGAHEVSAVSSLLFLHPIIISSPFSLLLLTSRVALADQLVGQDRDAQEVDGLGHDKQVVVVLHDQPEEAEELCV
jgi:hypothetical protein